MAERGSRMWGKPVKYCLGRSISHVHKPQLAERAIWGFVVKLLSNVARQILIHRTTVMLDRICLAKGWRRFPNKFPSPNGKTFVRQWTLPRKSSWNKVTEPGIFLVIQFPEVKTHIHTKREKLLVQIGQSFLEPQNPCQATKNQITSLTIGLRPQLQTRNRQTGTLDFYD